jgi:raffinose/stachyose/melibiose transport system permease protein
VRPALPRTGYLSIGVDGMLNRNMKKYYPFYFIVPALVPYLLVYIAAVVFGFGLAMTDWNVYSMAPSRFVGFDNFTLLLHNWQFGLALRHTVIFTVVTVVLKTVFALLVALMLNAKFPGRNFFRAAFFVPCVVSTLVVGYIFNFLYQFDGGLINQVLSWVGLDSLAKDWLGDPKLALVSVSMIDVWQWTGFSIVIILAGLQSVPKELIEASKIDGAGAFRTFQNVTFQFVRPAVNICIILSLIGGFKVFDVVMATTQGGPGFDTEVLGTMIFKSTNGGSLGYSGAVALVQFMIITIVTLPTLAALRKKEVEL